mgnify:CR=1 FL=1
MYLARVEETLHFDSGVFRGVGGVADVFHAGGAHVAADGSGGGFGGIGGAEEIADGGHSVFAFEHEGEHGAGAHELDDFREERAVGNVRVVFLEEVIGEGDKFGGADFEAGFFKAADDLAGMAAIEAVGFEQYE